MENKKITIVTAYYNRRQLFLNTLKTIEHSKYKDMVKILVIDDASNDENKIDDFIELFDLEIKIIRIEEKDKSWMNPCIPFNIGFKEVDTDIIIIQNPECMHFGDIIEYTLNNIKENLYLNFACYSVDYLITSQIKKIDLSTPNYKNKIGNLIYPLNTKPLTSDGTNAWYNHSIIRPHKLHFCSAITKKDLDELNGFDERFANGIAFDDNEFLLRIQRKNMEIKIIDNPFVVHQFHGNTNYNAKQEYFQKNHLLYLTIQNEKIYKAN